MKFLKFALIPVLALAALPLCAATAAALPLCAATAAAPASATCKMCCMPKAPAGTQFAALYRKNTAKALEPIVSAVVDGFKKSVLEQGDDAAEFEAFLKESGLSGSDIRWVSIPFKASATSGVDVTEAAISIAHDFARLTKAFRTQMTKEGRELAEVTVSGVKALKLTRQGGKDLLFLASLKGQLLLTSGSEDGLKVLLGLYAKNGAADAAYADLGANKDAMLSIRIARLGDMIGKMAPAQMLDQANAVLPDGKAMLLGMTNLDVILAGDDKKATLTVSVTMRSDADTQSLLTILNIFKASAATSGADPDDPAAKIVNAVKLSAKGKVLTAELSQSVDEVKALCEMAKNNL